VSVTVPIDGTPVAVPAAWLRLQCLCDECQIPAIRDRMFVLHSEPADLHAVSISDAEGEVTIEWSSGHMSVFPATELSRLAAISQRGTWRASHWGPEHPIRRVEAADFWADPDARTSALEAARGDGVAIISGVASESGEVERFLNRLGIALRETPFDRVHDVKAVPAGYTISDTSNALAPHNDLASYSWPPSGQALHMLRNCTEGGESILIDAWRVVEELRVDEPRMFAALTEVKAPHRTWSEAAENFSYEPMVRLDVDGRVAGVRFSNHTLQPLPLSEPRLDDFYAAYRELGRRFDDPANQLRLRMLDGDLLLISGHRIVHGRTAYAVTEAHRHVQDAYFDFDDLLGVLDRLTGVAR